MNILKLYIEEVLREVKIANSLSGKMLFHFVDNLLSLIKCLFDVFLSVFGFVAGVILYCLSPVIAIVFQVVKMFIWFYKL